MVRRVRPHLQLLVDFYQCAAPKQYLQNPTVIKRIFQDAVLRSGMEIIDSLFHQFARQGRGITGVFIVAESHLIVHTWPERNLLNLDIFFCNFNKNNERKAHQAVRRLVELYRPRRIAKRAIRHAL